MQEHLEHANNQDPFDDLVFDQETAPSRVKSKRSPTCLSASVRWSAGDYASVLPGPAASRAALLTLTALNLPQPAPD
jgi:hypothetical protein